MSLSGWGAPLLAVTLPAQSSTLTDFQVVINLTILSGITNFDCSAIFDEVGANSLKIAIEIGNTGNQAYCEIERWDNGEETAQLHVKIPSYISTSDTVLNIYADNAHADNTTYVGVTGSTAAQTVWRTVDKCILHMAQDPSGGTDCILDSTSNANHGTPNGSMTAGDLVDGRVGKALDFDGSNDYITIPDSASLDITSGITLLALINPVSVTNHGILAKSPLSSDQGVYQLTVATAGVGWYFRLNGSTTEGAGQESGGTPATGSWQAVFGRYDGSGIDLTVDTTQIGSSSYSTAITADTSPLQIGAYYTSSNVFSGKIEEIRVIEGGMSDDWMAVTLLSLSDSLVTYSLPSASTAVAAGIVQKISSLVENSLLQNIIDASVVAQLINQPVRNAAEVNGSINQPITAALQIQAELTALWTQYQGVYAGINQPLILCGAVVDNGVIQIIEMLDRHQVQADLIQRVSGYGSGDVAALVFGVIVDGVALESITGCQWQYSDGQYPQTATVTIADRTEYDSIQVQGTASIISYGVEYKYFVEKKSRSKDVGAELGKTFIIALISLSAGLDDPYAALIDYDLTTPESAQATVADLLADHAPGIDWQIDDYPLPDGYTWEQQTPMAIVRDIVSTVGAIVQTNPAGVVIVQDWLPAGFDAGAVDHALSEDGGFNAYADDGEPVAGYNYVEVSDQAATDGADGLSHETETLENGSIEVTGYQVPWDGLFDLITTGGAWVKIVYEGIFEEQLEEYVQFIDGIGQTSKSIYSTPVVDWRETDLGVVGHDESGHLTAATLAESLAWITYTTRYKKWTVTDLANESVQLIQTEA